MFEFTKEETNSILAHAGDIARQLKIWGYDSIRNFVEDGGMDTELIQLLIDSGCRLSKKSIRDYKYYLCEEVYNSSDCVNHPFWGYIRSLSEKVSNISPVEDMKLSVSEMEVDDLYQFFENKEESGEDIVDWLISHKDEPEIRIVIENYLNL